MNIKKPICCAKMHQIGMQPRPCGAVAFRAIIVNAKKREDNLIVSEA